tara:strand:+ start:4173 stop:6410 length:2238 start_codon:yes stop_codon:yes gene_type:complete
MAVRRTYKGGQVGMVNIPNIGQPQFRERAEAFNSLKSRIDLVKEFALEEGERLAIEKGVEDAVSNPIELQDFMTRNAEEQQEIVGTDKFTSYGQSLRKTNLLLLTTNLENAGEFGLNTIKMEAMSDPNKTSEDAYDEMSNYSIGIAETLMSTDPLAANELLTSLGAKTDELYLELLADKEEEMIEKAISQLENSYLNASVPNRATLDKYIDQLEIQNDQYNLGREFVNSTTISLRDKLVQSGIIYSNDVVKLAATHDDPEKGFKAILRYLDSGDPEELEKLFGQKTDNEPLYNSSAVKLQKFMKFISDNSGMDEISNKVIDKFEESIRANIKNRRIEGDRTRKREKDEIEAAQTRIEEKNKAIEQSAKLLAAGISRMDIALSDGILDEREKAYFKVANIGELIKKRDEEVEFLQSEYGNDGLIALKNIAVSPEMEIVENQSIEFTTTTGLADDIKLLVLDNTFTIDDTKKIQELMNIKDHFTADDLKEFGVDLPRKYNDMELKITPEDLIDVRSAIVDMKNDKNVNFLTDIMATFHNKMDIANHIQNMATDPNNQQSYINIREKDPEGLELYEKMDAALKVAMSYDDFDYDTFKNTTAESIADTHYASKLAPNAENISDFVRKTISVTQDMIANQSSARPGAATPKTGSTIISTVVPGTDIIKNQYDLNDIFKTLNTIEDVDRAIKVAKDLRADLVRLEYNDSKQYEATIEFPLLDSTEIDTLRENITNVIEKLQIQKRYKQQGN